MHYSYALFYLYASKCYSRFCTYKIFVFETFILSSTIFRQIFHSDKKSKITQRINDEILYLKILIDDKYYLKKNIKELVDVAITKLI